MLINTFLMNNNRALAQAVAAIILSSIALAQA